MGQDAQIAETRAAILEVASACAGVRSTGYQYDDEGSFLAFTADQLLAVTTYYVGATQRQRQTLALAGSGGSRVTRVYDVVLYVALLPEKPTNRDEQEAIETAEVYADLLPNHFGQHRRLALTGGRVFDIGEMTEDGAKLFALGGRWYGAITHKLPVITYV